MPSLTKVQTGFLEAVNPFTLASGTASAPIISFSDSAATGIFSPSTGALGFSTGSVQNALTILADGNVGIGTTNPGAKLHIRSTSSTTNIFENTGNTDSYLFLKNSTSGGYIGSRLNDIVFLPSNGVFEAMRIDSNGNIGIGTTNPWDKLVVYDGGIHFGTAPNSSNSGRISYNTANGNLDISAHSTGGSTYARILTSNAGSVTEKIRITSDGNVGIGTVGPGSKLHVEGTYPQIIVNNPTAGSGSTISFRNAGTVAGTIGHISTTAAIQFASDNGGTSANILTLRDGRLGIGESSPPTAIFVMANTDAKGSVAISANQNVPVQFALQQGYNGRQGLVFNSNGDSSNTSFALINNQGAKRLTLQTASYAIGVSSDLSTGWTERLCVTSGGNVGIGITNPTDKLHVLNGSITTDGLYGRRFTDFTSTSTTTGYIDTGFAPDTPAAVYQLYISVNPLTDGSSAYRDVVYGKVFYGTGWNGSTVTSYIYFVQESPSRMYLSGGSEIYVDVLFLRNGVMYNTLPFNDLYTNTQFRIVVNSPSQVGTYISATFHRVHY